MVNKKPILYFICLIFLVEASCSSSKTPIKYLQFIDNPENKLLSEVEIGPLKYTCQLQPAEYTIIKQLGLSGLKKFQFDELLKVKKNYWQFDLKIQLIEVNGNSLFKSIAKDVQQYSELNQYFSQANTDFKILVGKEVIPLSTYYFTPNQGFSPYEEILIGSNQINPRALDTSSSFQLLYEDKIFHHGPIYFTFYKNDINKIPTLKL